MTKGIAQSRSIALYVAGASLLMLSFAFSAHAQTENEKVAFMEGQVSVIEKFFGISHGEVLGAFSTSERQGGGGGGGMMGGGFSSGGWGGGSDDDTAGPRGWNQSSSTADKAAFHKKKIEELTARIAFINKRIEEHKSALAGIKSVPGPDKHATSTKGFRAAPAMGKAPLTVELAGMPAAVQKKMNECKFSRGRVGASGNGLTVDWGDGTIAPRVAASTTMSGSCTDVVKKHTYTKDGTYKITVRSWYPGPTDASIDDWVGTTVVRVGAPTGPSSGSSGDAGSYGGRVRGGGNGGSGSTSTISL